MGLVVTPIWNDAVAPPQLSQSFQCIRFGRLHAGAEPWRAERGCLEPWRPPPAVALPSSQELVYGSGFAPT